MVTSRSGKRRLHVGEAQVADYLRAVYLADCDNIAVGHEIGALHLRCPEIIVLGYEQRLAHRYHVVLLEDGVADGEIELHGAFVGAGYEYRLVDAVVII